MNALDPQPSKKKITLFVIVLCAAPLLLLVALELSARLLISIVFWHPEKSYGIYKPDAVLGHFPEANTYNHITALNDHAFRNVQNLIEPKPKGAERIIAYGGSTTFCPRLSTKECWPARLEHHMRAADDNQDHQVLNGGIVVWSLGHVLERAKRDIRKLHPDRVLIYSGFNEVTNAHYLELAGTPIEHFVQNGRYGVVAKNYPASHWLSFNSLIFKIARSFMVSGLGHMQSAIRQTIKAEKTGGNQRKEALGGAETLLPKTNRSNKMKRTLTKQSSTNITAMQENYLKVLKQLIEFIEASGSEPVFVIQASINPHKTQMSEKGAELSCHEGLRVFDAREMVASYQGDRQELFASPIHYNSKGAERFGKFLYEKMFRGGGASWCNR